MTEGRKHIYAIDMVWTGAEDGPAKDYRGYSREHRFTAPGKPALLSSADPAFRGDESSRFYWKEKAHVGGLLWKMPCVQRLQRATGASKGW